MAEVAKINIDGVEWDIRDDILTERFEQFLQQRNTQRDYSTNETDTGKKWINGKTIYCKVFPYSSSYTITNLDFIIKAIPIFDNNSISGLYYYNSSNMDTLNRSGDTIYSRRAGNQSSMRILYYIFEYTKTI